MTLKNKVLPSWLALIAILAVISVLILFMAPPGKKQVLFWAVALLFLFAVVWYIPHICRERWFTPSSLPAVYFLSGTALIVLGCFSSAFFAAAVRQQGQWEHIAEVVPLVLGAVVGGTYCCDAILGQEFDGNPFRLGFLGSLPGALLIAAVLGTLCLSPVQPGICISILFAAGFPAIAIAVMEKLRNSDKVSDVAFFVFLTGVSLILVAAVSAIWILASAMNYQPRFAFLDETQVLNIVKNLVPSYCGAIGAGLITRGMEENVTPFSLENWVIRHFDAFEFISATGNQVQFRLKRPSGPDQVIVMILDETALQTMRSKSRERARYGQEVHEWLIDMAKRKHQRKLPSLQLHAPGMEILGEKKRN